MKGKQHLEWIILIIIVYYSIEYFNKLQIKKWNTDKNKRNYKLVSTNTKTYHGNIAHKQLYLDIVVTDGYIIVEDIKYFRNSSTGYISESKDELIFVEHKHLYYSYTKDNTSANEFIFRNEIKSVDKKSKIQTPINEQLKSQKNTYYKKYQQLSREDILLNSLSITHIYHMTHIDNLSSTLHTGLLPHENSHKNVDISNQDVNNRRSTNEPIYNRPIHSYVPFYFNPKNAMLYSMKERQNYLVIIAVNRSLIYQNNSLFTDGNAASTESKFYKDLSYIKTLDWKCINAKSWNEFQDGKRIKMAEILVFNHVPSVYIDKLYCQNNHLKQYIESLLTKHSNITVEVNKSLFF